MSRITIALILLPLGMALGHAAQDPPPLPVPKAAPANDIFSGTISDLTTESVTVIRSAIAREAVKRTFILDSQTVVEGTMKAKARVTVRYATDDNGLFHALHIIVR